MLILSGSAAREELKKPLMEKLEALREKRGPFSLAIVQVGDRPDSAAYIKAKMKFATEIGADVSLIHLPETASQAEVASEVSKLNNDRTVAGIIVQLPLPKGLDARAILDSIDPAKDADAIASANMRKWKACDAGALWPATARGVRELLDFYGVSLKDKKVCVVGRSELVGAPIALMCHAAGAEVIVCHSKTIDLAGETRKADVVICAVGKPKLLGAAHVKPGQTVIDVGINTAKGDKLEDEVAGRKLLGDVDFDAVKDVVSAVSPVPGGVGPMTVLALFENLADCATMQG